MSANNVDDLILNYRHVYPHSLHIFSGILNLLLVMIHGLHLMIINIKMNTRDIKKFYLSESTYFHRIFLVFFVKTVGSISKLYCYG